MTMRQFIKEHRKELDYIIQQILGKDYRLNDKDRQDWILSDEGLYLWARSEGVKI